LRLLRQAKEWQEQDGTEQERSHYCLHHNILLLQALQKNRETAHIGLKTLKKT
jgi:hypothetical protein